MIGLCNYCCDSVLEYEWVCEVVVDVAATWKCW